MKIGCHAVLFAERIASDTENIVRSFSNTGCDGIEVGSRFLKERTREVLLQSLGENNLRLSGLHASIHLTDVIDRPKDVFQYLQDVAGILEGTECNRIILTGMPENENLPAQDLGDPRLEDPAFLKRMAQELELFVKELWQETGVQVCYHNHNWEFFHNALIYNALMTYTQTLHFALDIGWAEAAGYSALSLVEQAPTRFPYLHLRDFRREDIQGMTRFSDVQPLFSNIGEGDLDYPAMMNRFKQLLGEDEWCVIEYEKGAVDISRYEKAVAAVKSML